MEIKLTMKYHIIPIWLAKVKGKDGIVSWQKCGERAILTHSWRECEGRSHLRTVWPHLAELNVQTLKSSAKPSLMTEPEDILSRGHRKIRTRVFMALYWHKVAVLLPWRSRGVNMWWEANWEMGNTLQLSGKKKSDLNAAAAADLRNDAEDFPGGPVVNNLPALAGDTGLTPGLGRFTCHRATHAPQLLSPCALETTFPNKRKSPQWAARAPQQRVAPSLHN